ncbi:glycogenin-1-like isoform X4 [Watersipora subatra]|uniref:glycogenin-1-like isoform X4 n=1 Tax=Watersipora subatra TaxID=2589382 RepID=UPI00355B56ED
MAVTDTIMNTAYVTLATNDTYCVGALVVASSLRLAHTSSSIVCMITPEVSQPMREILEKTFNQIYLVDVLDSHDSDNLALLDRPELGVTFTKLHCWRLEQYKKCVFLDSDTLVLANCDELFEREELSAAPDPGWPDCFNSGVFVYTPNKDTYKKLMNFAVKEGSFDGGDQGLLNLYFSDWAHADISKHLPFLYNVVSQAFYSYLPAFKRFGDKTKICHFIGPVKPWHHRFSETTGRAIEQSQTGFSSEFLQRWWEIFTTYVYPLISQSHMPETPSLNETRPQTFQLESLMPQLAGLTLTPTDNSAVPLHTPAAGRQEDWERGVIDYRGVDSFEQIRRHIDMKLAEESPQKTKTKSLFSTTSGTPDLASKFMVSEGAEARPKVSQSADTRPKESLSADTRPKVAQDADTRPKVLPSSKPIKSVLKKT